MPMTFTDDMVRERLARCTLSTAGTMPELRERLAKYTEDKYGDLVEAWEIRTGRPWTAMTKEEALILITMHPTLMRNPAVLSKSLGR
jgi:hypothetical protein